MFVCLFVCLFSKVQKQLLTNANQQEALRNAVVKYGESNWSAIVNDPAYDISLNARSNVDCKDKWRNMKRQDMYSEIPRKMQEVSTGPRVLGGGIVANVNQIGPVLNMRKRVGNLSLSTNFINEDDEEIDPYMGTVISQAVIATAVPKQIRELDSIRAEIEQVSSVMPMQRILNRVNRLQETMVGDAKRAEIDLELNEDQTPDEEYAGKMLNELPVEDRVGRKVTMKGDDTHVGVVTKSQKMGWVSVQFGSEVLKVRSTEVRVSNGKPQEEGDDDEEENTGRRAKVNKKGKGKKLKPAAEKDIVENDDLVLEDGTVVKVMSNKGGWVTCDIGGGEEKKFRRRKLFNTEYEKAPASKAKSKKKKPAKGGKKGKAAAAGKGSKGKGKKRSRSTDDDDEPRAGSRRSKRNKPSPATSKPAPAGKKGKGKGKGKGKTAAKKTQPSAKSTRSTRSAKAKPAAAAKAKAKAKPKAKAKAKPAPKSKTKGWVYEEVSSDDDSDATVPKGKAQAKAKPKAKAKEKPAAKSKSKGWVYEEVSSDDDSDDDQAEKVVYIAKKSKGKQQGGGKKKYGRRQKR